MKIPAILLCTLSISLFMVSCKKEKVPTYAPSGDYGINILHGNDTAFLSKTGSYSLQASMGKKMEVEVVITNKSERDSVFNKLPSWFFSNESGWRVGDYNNSSNEQTFNSNSSKSVDLELVFSDNMNTGIAHIEIIENGITKKSKVMIWK